MGGNVMVLLGKKVLALVSLSGLSFCRCECDQARGNWSLVSLSRSPLQALVSRLKKFGL